MWTTLQASEQNDFMSTFQTLRNNSLTSIGMRYIAMYTYVASCFSLNLVGKNPETDVVGLAWISGN